MSKLNNPIVADTTTDNGNNSGVQTQILSVGTATPKTGYSQAEVIELFGIKDKRTQSVYLNSAIDNRYLSLPLKSDKINPGDVHGTTESQGELLAKHKSQAIKVGAQALKNCLAQCGATIEDVASLCCVTSTGLLTPGLSALLVRELKINSDCNRLDIVGMGCNAGLNGLNAASRWAQTNPGKLSILLCIEMCSAAYVVDGTLETSVVNSLFGDGASALAIKASPSKPSETQPHICAFSSHIITDAIDDMCFNWCDSHGKFSFFLAKEVPYVVGANVETAVSRLLNKVALRQSQIDHWIVHSGGKKVIDSIKINLGLSAADLRHTTTVLREYGNVSSGSFLFSYQKLLQENSVKQGDICMMITMGPGATIETALIKF